ncbi:MAG: STAS domain-containing protein [Planctomycetota bacterium]
MTTLLTRHSEDILIAYFQDVRIIDETRIQALGQELSDLINNSDNRKIVLNFQNVSFMSSAMIGKLIQFGKKCEAAKVELRLCNINDNVEEVFKLMKLEKVFQIDKDEEKAVAALGKKGLFG